MGDGARSIAESAARARQPRAWEGKRPKQSKLARPSTRSTGHFCRGYYPLTFYIQNRIICVPDKSISAMHKNNKTKAESSRRKFIKQSVIASSILIVPRHVLGGIGFTAPSDQLVVAAIGAGGKGIS